MKKILTITLTMAAIALVSASKCSADENSNAKSLHRQIEKTLYFPDEARNNVENAVVYVSFSVNAESKIVIHEIHGSSKLLSDFVERRLTALNLNKVSTDAGKEYVYKMSFLKEK